MKQRIRRAWVKTLAKLTPARSKWQCVRGPISAAVATLIDVGWQPIDPSEWITSASDGTSLSGNASSNLLAGFTKTKGHAVRQVLHRLEGDLEADVWNKASLSYNGKGLERGLPSFEPASKAHANFVRKGEYKKAKAIELAVNNKIWTKQRLLESKIIEESEAMCERCGGIHIETNFHRYYDCSANHAIEHDDVSKTHYLAKNAKLMPHLACKWYRAIMPGDTTSLPVGWPLGRKTTTTTRISRSGSMQAGTWAPTAPAEWTPTPERDGCTRELPS